ncbi:MAG TPA: IS30 family transposase [Caulobacteraceae bacterium]|jgi:IS30 family transposase|nr:IS30 family transposase [Caulobacteraceae bacterium]
MGSSYGQLTLDERCKIAELRGSGCSIRQIAAALDRSPSSISRELKRNAAAQADYRPDYAQQKTAARRWSGSRLERDAPLREQVLDALAQGCSPAQVVGRLKRQHGRTVIGRETIYRFVYAQLKRTNDRAWRNYLPRGKARRGWRARKGGSPAGFIKDRVPISQRSSQADDRRQAGHWEADFMLFSRYGQNLLVLHERASRFTALVKTENRRAEPTAGLLAKLLEPLPKRLRRTLTFDNGTEFAEHYRLRRHPGLKTFFCDPHAPWQKGGVENAIGRFRRMLPRKTDLDSVDPDQILRCIQAYNHTPRQCLDFQTPAEVFSQLLHFKRDSTSSPSRG